MGVVDALWCDLTATCVSCLQSREASVDAGLAVLQEVECVSVRVMFVQLRQYFYLNKQKKPHTLCIKKNL